MFKNSNVSYGKAKVVSLAVESEKTVIVVLEYTPFKSNRPWRIMFESAQGKSGDSSRVLLDHLYKGTTLEAELVGLGSWFPLIDNIKYALGFDLIKIDESNVKTLEPFVKPVLVQMS